jgi:hypothetical protein
MRAIPFKALRWGMLALVLGLAAVVPSAAQESHTVRIRDGAVFVDGRRVPQDELPASLRASELQLHLEFTGPAHFHLDGVEYGIEDGRIVEVPPGEDRVVIFFSGNEGELVEVPEPPGTALRLRLDGPPDGAIGTYFQVLDEQAAQFERIGEQIAAQRMENFAVMADRLREEAEQTAIMVRAFPRVEVQTYLQGIQNRDRSLYDQLMREQRLELASGELARRIFATEDPESRASLTENLHRQLDEIFELKQENRRDEIAELELQLQELREQLAAREANREAIIGRRLEALLANPHR